MREAKITKDGLFIPLEIADAITVENLKETLEQIKHDLEDHENGEWMHPDDVVFNKEFIPILEKVIWYYGG